MVRFRSGLIGVLAVVMLASSASAASATVSVGVADTGVAANLGGLVQPGWNFLAKNSDTSDWVWHGTFVAGLIQAEAQTHATVVPLRICNLTNVSNSVPPASCNATALANAVKWAATHGIRIVNDSINFSGANSALRSAIQSNPNVLVVAAAGNLKKNLDTSPQYPCNFDLPNVICVTATGPGDVLWSRADIGQTVELAAPGVNVAGQTPWTPQSYPANLTTGTNCEVQFGLKGTANSTSPLTITGKAGTTSATIGQWTGSLANFDTANYAFPQVLQGKTNVTVSLSGGQVTTQNLIAQCQGPTTQPFTSSGGSFSAATVSGAAAVLEDTYPTATTAQIVAAILNGATFDVTPAGSINGNRELNLAGAEAQLGGGSPAP
jgi:Subtilase family